MNLAGKYLAFWVSGEALDRAFGIYDAPSPAGERWSLMGRVVGETPGLGLWVSVESVTSPLGPTNQLKTPTERAPTLFFWVDIIGAVAFDAQPDKRPIGFLSELRGEKKSAS